MIHNTICAVIVTYGQHYLHTVTYQSLLRVATLLGYLKFHIIVYDNSPSKCDIKPNDIFACFIYHHDASNTGVVSGYVYAIEYCIKNGINWLLRLDQDSCFDENLILDFLSVPNVNDYYAICPKILCKGNIVSPSIVLKGGILRPVKQTCFGVCDYRITFINSMSFINIGEIDVVKKIQLLKSQLDLSDHEFALSLPRHKIYVMKINVNHNLSITDKSYVSTKRYSMILINESRLILQNEGLYGRIIFKTRLLVRLFKFVIKGRIDCAKLSFMAMLNIYDY